MKQSESSTRPPCGFPTNEFEARVTKAQRLMTAANLDALLLTTEPEIRYFTGFLTQFWQSPTRPWFLVVPKKGKPIAVIPEIGAECMAQTWIDDIRTWPAPQPSDDGISLLVSTLNKVVGKTGNLGLPMGHETHVRMPLLNFFTLRQRLRRIEVVDATDLLQTLRVVKSKAEIAKIAYICDVASTAFEALPSLISVGQTEHEIFQTFKIECLRQGADDVPYLVGGAGQGGYKDIISPPSNTATQAGDLLILDTGCLFDGYFCDFDRNFALSDPSDDVKRAYEVVYQATEAGLAAARPGATCADLFHAMQSVLEEGGALGNEVGRLGHGLGVQLTEFPSHTPWDRTVLKAGMVVTLEPSMTFAPGRMMVHEENIVIRKDGPQLLTRRAPRELPVVD